MRLVVLALSSVILTLRGAKGKAAAGLRMTPVLWAWERREDLRFLGEAKTVAFYAGILTLTRDSVVVEPRRNPLLLARRTRRIAVVRIQTNHPRLDAAQRRETVDAIAHLFRNAEELQIDFDASASERAFYRALLFDVRREIDAPLTITALASWFMDDRWMTGLPIDDAIPMLFRMGGDAHAIRARLARGEDFREPQCRASIGVSLDEPMIAPRGRRVWVFNSDRWTEDAWKRAKRFASR